MSQQIKTASPEKTKQRHVERRESRPDSAQSLQRGLHPIAQLQRMVGNRRVAQLIQAKRLTPDGKMIGLQRKLIVGAADDQYEQEADRVARQVLNTSDAVAAHAMQRAMSPEEDQDQMLQLKPLAASITPFVQRQMGQNEESEDQGQSVQAKVFTETSQAPLQRQPDTEEEETEPIQAKSVGALADSFEAGADVETQVSQGKGHGSPLPDAVRTYMEPRFSIDFSQVRVHTGTQAARAAKDINATAFTHGQDIFFDEGQFHRGTTAGDKLLAHELTHTIQQGESSGVQLKSSEGAAISQPDDADEQQAEKTAEQVSTGAAYGAPADQEGFPAQLIGQTESQGKLEKSLQPGTQHKDEGKRAQIALDSHTVSPSGFGLAASQRAAGNMAMKLAARESSSGEAPVRSESALNVLSVHDVSHIRSHQGGAVSDAAHVVQQRAGVQRAPAKAGAGGGKEVTPPKGGINKTGFIDHSDGSNIRTGPAESGGQPVRDQPLPPATRVFVSGTHPDTSDWWYVTAFIGGAMFRGYVQHFRVATDLPEPMAKLHQVVSGDTAEKLAVQEFSTAVRDGHDLRYYENVLLQVNNDKGRAGIVGSYQNPGLLGGGSNNIQLVAGHRIWLVSPAYARALEGVVPAGSLTGGAYAKVKRFVGHIEDIIKSVVESRNHLDEVAGEYAEAIREHIVEIVGIVAGFIMAESLSAFLATVPTGVSQIVAVIIQLGLAVFGAMGMVEAGVQALKHGSEWLTLAWTAKGNDERIVDASKEFLKMLVSLAMAALAYLGVKGNYAKAVKIANALPTGAMPAFAFAGGGQMGGAGARTAVAIGPPGIAGPFGTAGGMMMEGGEKGGKGARGNFETRVENEVKERFKDDPVTESWELIKLEKSKKRMEPSNLDHNLGPTQERWYATFRDFFGETRKMSVNYDPKTGSFGIIKKSGDQP